MSGSDTVCHSAVKLYRTSTYWRKKMGERWKRGLWQHPGWQIFWGSGCIYWLKTVCAASQECISAWHRWFVSRCCEFELWQRELRHVLKYRLHQLHSSPWQPWLFYFFHSPMQWNGALCIEQGGVGGWLFVKHTTHTCQNLSLHCVAVFWLA